MHQNLVNTTEANLSCKGTENGFCKTSTDVYPEATVEDISAEMCGVLPPPSPAADAPLLLAEANLSCKGTENGFYTTNTDVYPEATVEDISAEMCGVLPPPSPAADAPLQCTIAEGSRDRIPVGYDTNTVPTTTVELQPEPPPSIFDWHFKPCVTHGVYYCVDWPRRKHNEDSYNYLTACWLLLCLTLLQFWTWLVLLYHIREYPPVVVNSLAYGGRGCFFSNRRWGRKSRMFNATLGYPGEGPDVSVLARVCRCTVLVCACECADVSVLLCVTCVCVTCVCVHMCVCVGGVLTMCLFGLTCRNCREVPVTLI